MVKVDLKGIAKVKAKGRTYYYAWRGGPRLRGEPGSPEFMASYNEAIEIRNVADPGRFKSLVMLYRASPDYTKNLAYSTRKNWSPWLDRIADYFGELRIAQGHPPLAQSMGGETEDGGLWNASLVTGALLCG
jgi:hypothetical protein